MSATKEHHSEPADRAFVITRAFNAPRDLVFGAWTECEHLKHWWGPKGFTIASCTNDLRPGGVFHYGMQAPDGNTMWGKWVYRDIVRPERLVVIVSFSDGAGGQTRHPFEPDWPLQTISTMTFAEHEGRTTLTVQWLPYEATETERKTFAASHGSMQQGWTGTLDQLDQYLTDPRH